MSKIGILAIIRKNIWEMIFVALSFSLIVVTSFLFVSNIVRKQISNHAREMLLAAETSIRSDFREVEVTLINASDYILYGLESGWTIEDLKRYLVWKYRTAGPGEANIPGFYDIFCYKDGQLLSGGPFDIPPGDYDPRTRPWYASTVQAQGKVSYSSLYQDLITGEAVVSLTRMMGTDEDRWFVGVDITLDTLFEFVSSLQFADSGYGMLLDNALRVFIHANSEFIDRPFAELSRQHALFVQDIQNASGEVVVRQMPNWQGTMMMLVAKRLYNGWYLAISTPTSTYYQDVYFMARVISVLGIVSMIVLCLILLRLNILKVRSDEESKDKTSFLARMSHEIRTPMNSILGMAELIQRKAVSTEIQEYVNIISQSGDTLLAIINDILDFSKIESGQYQIQSRRYHPASVINDVINVIRPRAAEKSLDFFVDVDSSLPAELTGDDVRIRQILINLLSNAVKYTQRGFIALSVDKEYIDDYHIRIIFTVKDSGVGIKPEDISRLFSEFSRVDTKANQGIEGTGLGLAITRALCDAMGGSVTVESEYGMGSSFRAAVVQVTGLSGPIARVSEPKSKRVLFYDWRPQYVQSLTRIFKDLGIRADSVVSFQKFTVALEHGDYDYAFISSKHALDSIYILGKRTSPLQLVVMVELGEISVFREVSSVMMPVYSVTLANVLNDQIDKDQDRTAKFRVHFTAPSAKVLIVDDISTNLRVAKELMAPYNMNIHICLSGAESIDMVKNNHYDMVFMDHMMPGMDGIESVSFIRALETEDDYAKKLPIIALTANAVSGQREMFLQSGINDFLAKPIDIQKLNDILEKWLPADKRLEKQAEPASPGEDGGQEKTGGLSLPGMDTETGLRNVGGSMAVYLDILADFARDVDSRAEKINQALEAGDVKLYATLVHALKGASRGIGAVELGEAAAWLEASAGKEDPALIRNKTAELLEEQKALAGAIMAETARRSAASPAGEHGGVEILHLENLKSALEATNIEEVNKIFLEFSGLMLDPETRGLVAELEQQVLMFEYDKAVGKIEGILEGRGKKDR